MVDVTIHGWLQPLISAPFLLFLPSCVTLKVHIDTRYMIWLTQHVLSTLSLFARGALRHISVCWWYHVQPTPPRKLGSIFQYAPILYQMTVTKEDNMVHCANPLADKLSPPNDHYRKEKDIGHRYRRETSACSAAWSVNGTICSSAISVQPHHQFTILLSWSPVGFDA